MSDVQNYPILDTDANVTLTASTSAVESEVLNYRVPDKTIIKIKNGAGFWYYPLINSVLATGTWTLYKASVDKKSRVKQIATGKIAEVTANNTPYDQTLAYRLKLPIDVIITAKEYLVLKVTATGSIATTGTTFRLETVMIQEFSL